MARKSASPKHRQQLSQIFSSSKSHRSHPPHSRQICPASKIHSFKEIASFLEKFSPPKRFSCFQRENIQNGGIRMLYAASVKITHGKNQRRLDLVVEAVSPEEAETKALKQARKMYCPGKKAIYTIMTLIDETEAMAAFNSPSSQVPEETASAQQDEDPYSHDL